MIIDEIEDTSEAHILREAAGLAAYGRLIATAVGGRVDEWIGVVMCSGGFAGRYRNMVVPLRPVPADHAPGLAERLIRFYGAKEGWLLWNVFADDLSLGGFISRAANPIMERTESRSLKMPYCPWLSVREVADDAGVRLFERTRETANGRTMPHERWKSGFLDGRVLGKGLRMWLGYLDDEPVATAATFEHSDISMIKNISVVPTFRGLGIGTYMSVHAIRACSNFPLLDSDPPARRLYTRLGFQQIGTVTFWRLDD